MLLRTSRVVLLTALACGLTATAVAQNPPAPKIVLSKTGWNFGEVWHGETPTTTVDIRNEGNAPLRLTKVKACCGSNATQPARMVIPPGESETITLTFDSLNKQHKVKSKLVVRSNDPVNPEIRFVIEGFIKRPVERDPAGGVIIHSLETGPGLVGTVHLENKMDQPLKLKRLNEFEHLDVQIKEIKPGLLYDLTVTTTRALPIGGYRHDIWLETGLKDHPRIYVPVFITIVAPVEAMPSVIYVNPAETQPPKQKIIMLQNYGPQPFEIKEARCTLDAIRVRVGPAETYPGRATPGRARPNAFVRAFVTLPPADQIPAEGVTIEFLTNNPDCATVEVFVTKDLAEFQKLHNPFSGPRKSRG